MPRLLKALRGGRPESARQFFALACQHMRWELNDLARRFDEQPTVVELCAESVPAPSSSDSGLTPDGRRILAAIKHLPQGEREAFNLVRIQGISQTEAARILEVSVMTVKRRLSRSLQTADRRTRGSIPGRRGPCRVQVGVQFLCNWWAFGVQFPCNWWVFGVQFCA